MTIAERWHGFWFAPAPLERLAIFRILVLSLALWDLNMYGITAFADAAAVDAGTIQKVWRPIYLFEVLGLEPAGLGTARLVFTVGWISMACGILGLFSRTACAVAAVVVIYWTGLVYSFGKPHHDKVALAFAVMALPLAPVGACLSVDSLLRRVRGLRRTATTHELAGVPIRLTQITITIGYCFAGWTKMAVSGLSWLNGYSLMGILTVHDNEWSAFLCQDVWLCQVLSLGAILVQGTFFMVLVWPASRWFYLPSVIAFHVMTWKAMDTGPYMTLWFLLVCFLPLERVAGWVATGLSRGPLIRRGFVLATCVTPAFVVLHAVLVSLGWW